MAKIQLDKEIKSTLTSEIATRQTYQQYISLYNSLPDPDPILRKLNKDISVYKELTSDPHVYSLIQQRQSGVLSQSKTIKQNNSSSAVFDFVNNIFDNLDIDNITAQMLNAPLLGMSVLEIIWKYDKRKLIPADILEKPQEWFSFDNNNNLILLPPLFSREVGDPSGRGKGGELPKYKFLLVRSRPTYSNPYGERALSRVYWPLTFKRGGLKFWVTFAEKYGSPYMFGKVPRSIGSEAVDDLLTKLDNLISDAVAVIPDDSTVDIKWPESGAAVDAYRMFIEFLNAEMSKAILTQTLTTEIQNKGSYSASKTHEQLLAQLIDSDRKLIEKSYNELIRYLVELNFGVNIPLPTYHLHKESEEQLKAAEERLKITSERDNNLKTLGIQLTPDYIKRVYNLSDTDFKISPASSPESLLSLLSRSSHFSSSATTIEAQSLIDSLLPAISDKKLITAQNELDSQLLDIIRAAQNYDDLVTTILDSYPDITATKLEALLERATFIANIIGQSLTPGGDQSV